MLLKVLPANRAVVPPAGLSARVPVVGLFVPTIMKTLLLRALRVPCMTLSALNAAKPPKFPSSRQALDPFTVQTAITPRVLPAVLVLLIRRVRAAVLSSVLPEAAAPLNLRAAGLLEADAANRVLPDLAKAVSIPLISAITAISAAIPTALPIRGAAAASATISARTRSAAAKKAEEAVPKGAITLTMTTMKCTINY